MKKENLMKLALPLGAMGIGALIGEKICSVLSDTKTAESYDIEIDFGKIKIKKGD